MNQQYRCPSSVLFRMSMCSLAIVCYVNSIIEPRSLVAQFAATAASGPFLCLLLGIFGVIGILDAIINDLLRDQIQWKSVKKHRHFVLLALAACYLMSLFVQFINFRSPALSLLYVWNAVSLVTLAFVDAYQRSWGRRAYD